mgnify:CR=1 FL=1
MGYKITQCRTCRKDLPKNSQAVWHTMRNGLPITNHCSEECVKRFNAQQIAMAKLNSFFAKELR